MCVGVLLAYMSVHCLGASCLWMHWIPGTGAADSCGMKAGNQTWVLWKLSSALGCQAIPPAPSCVVLNLTSVQVLNLFLAFRLLAIVRPAQHSLTL